MKILAHDGGGCDGGTSASSICMRPIIPMAYRIPISLFGAFTCCLRISNTRLEICSCQLFLTARSIVEP